MLDFVFNVQQLHFGCWHESSFEQLVELLPPADNAAYAQYVIREKNRGQLFGMDILKVKWIFENSTVHATLFERRLSCCGVCWSLAGPVHV